MRPRKALTDNDPKYLTAAICQMLIYKLADCVLPGFSLTHPWNANMKAMNDLPYVSTLT